MRATVSAVPAGSMAVTSEYGTVRSRTVMRFASQVSTGITGSPASRAVAAMADAAWSATRPLAALTITTGESDAG